MRDESLLIRNQKKVVTWSKAGVDWKGKLQTLGKQRASKLNGVSIGEIDQFDEFKLLGGAWWIVHQFRNGQIGSFGEVSC